MYECASAYFIQPPMVGLLDEASFSNITEQHKMLYQDTLAPQCVAIEEDIDLQLLPEFADTEGIYCEFNLEEKLKGSFEEQTKSLQSAVGGPYMTRNEARARMNLPSLPEGDTLITPLNVTKGGQASPRDSSPDKTVVLQHFIDRQARVLASNGGKYDPDRWQRELAEDLDRCGG
jgi:phage portal protein BeeE